VDNTLRILTLVLGISLVAACSAGADDTKIVMHVVPHQSYMHCYVPEELGYRDPAHDTMTDIDTGEDVYVFFYLLDYDVALGVGFQITWPAGWQFRGWTGPCLSNQITSFAEQSTALHVGSVFDEVTGGAVVPVGYARFLSGASGEVRMIGSDTMCVGGGVCLVTTNLEGEVVEVTIGEEMLGSAAIGGGYNPAQPLPVDATTWGLVKAQYR
jgi:hypothetical protein